MTKKYTQGPWVQAGYSISAKGSGHIAKALEVYMDRQTREANARLISCAPELLEALEMIYNHPNTRHEVEANIGSDVWEIIKKAKGE